jgi:hypothetical protein
LGFWWVVGCLGVVLLVEFGVSRWFGVVGYVDFCRKMLKGEGWTEERYMYRGQRPVPV